MIRALSYAGIPLAGMAVAWLIYRSRSLEEAGIRRRARRRSVVIEDAIHENAADNYDLLQRYERWVAGVLMADNDVPFLTPSQRATGVALLDEFRNPSRKKGG